MESESQDTFKELLAEKRKITYMLVENFITNILNEISITGAFSNADLLLLIDDLLENIKPMISSQIKQIAGEFEEDNVSRLKKCINEAVIFSDEKLDIKKETIALKVTKMSFVSENSVIKTITGIEKEVKSVIAKTMYKLEQCL